VKDTKVGKINPNHLSVCMQPYNHLAEVPGMSVFNPSSNIEPDLLHSFYTIHSQTHTV